MPTNTTRAKEAFGEFNKKVEPIAGLLGIPIDGSKKVDVPNRPGYVYVRLRNNTNELIQAFNEKVSPVYDLPILVEFKQNRYVVIGRDTERYTSWGSSSSYIPSHGSQHSLLANQSGGGDPVWVDSRQILAGALYPSGTQGAPNVLISEYLLRNKLGEWVYIGNTGTADLASQRPDDSFARMMLVCLDYTSGGFVILTGTTFPSTLTGTSEIYPYIPAPNLEQIPIGAVRIPSGTTKIGWDNIYDTRQWFDSGFLTGSTGGGGAGTPGGNNTNVQFNDNDAFGGVDNFTYDKINNTVYIGDGTPSPLDAQLVDIAREDNSNSSNGTGSFVALTTISDDVSSKLTFVRFRAGLYDNLEDDVHGEIDWRGNDGDVTSPVSRIRSVANQDYFGGANGSRMEFLVTPNNTTSMFLILRLQSNLVTVNSNMSMSSNRITNLQNPQDPQDAATKNYVDNITGSGGTPGGNNGNIQFKENVNTFGGSDAFTWNNSTGIYLGAPGTPPIVEDSLFDIVADNSSPTMQFWTYGTFKAAGIKSYKARGTLASPTATGGDEVLFRIGGFGHDGVGWLGPQAEIQLVSEQEWNPTGTGASIAFFATPPHDISSAQIMLIGGNRVFLYKDLSMESNYIQNTLDPINPQDVATKNYVDTLVDIITGSGGTSPGGNNNTVQFNNGGVFGGSDAFKWNTSTGIYVGFPGTPPVLGGLSDFVGNQTSAAHQIWSYGTNVAPFVVGFRARGTLASPTAVQSDDVLMRVRARGYDGTDWSTTLSELRFVASENQTASNHGSHIELLVTPTGSTTLTSRVEIRDDYTVIKNRLSMNSNRINDVVNPILAQDAATKNYVDNVTGSVKFTDVGTSPNNQGASVTTGTVVTLQPASASFPGVLSITDQSIAGNKTFTGDVITKAGYSTDPFRYLDIPPLEFLSAAIHSPYVQSAVGAGTRTSIASIANHPGLIQISNNSAANAGWEVDLGHDSSLLLAGGEVYNMIFRIDTTAQTIQHRYGFQDVFNVGLPTDGVWISITGTILEGRTANNNSRSLAATTYTVSTNVWYRANIFINSISLVTFKLFDSDSNTLLWNETLTTNIPSATGRETSMGAIVYRTNTTNANLVTWDFMHLHNEKLLVR